MTNQIRPARTDGRVLFIVVAVRGEAVELCDEADYKFVVSRTSLGLDLVRPGQIISGRVKIGSQSEIEDSFVEDAPADLSERKQFESAGLDSIGWTPGIATGKGFEKQ